MQHEKHNSQIAEDNSENGNQSKNNGSAVTAPFGYGVLNRRFILSEIFQTKPSSVSRPSRRSTHRLSFVISHLFSIHCINSRIYCRFKPKIKKSYKFQEIVFHLYAHEYRLFLFFFVAASPITACDWAVFTPARNCCYEQFSTRNGENESVDNGKPIVCQNLIQIK